MTEEPLPAPTGPKAFAVYLQRAMQEEAAAEEPAAPAPARARRKPAGAAANDSPDKLSKQHGMTALELETCRVVLSMLAKQRDADDFRQPVDPIALRIPDYSNVVKQPMDLKTVREKLRNGQYRSMQEWHADLQLIWDNARTYNGADHKVTKQALKLQSLVEQRMDAAREVAEANLQAQDRGEAKPRKSISKPRSSPELTAGLPGAPGSSWDTDSLSEDGPGAMRSTEQQQPAGTRLANASSGSAQQAPPVAPKPPAGIKREAAEAAAGRAAKRRPGASQAAAATAAAAGPGSSPGLDVESLIALLDTPMARQLGAEELDDLAFLALWKRLMARKQQLASAATEAQPLQARNQQLQADLAAAQARVRQLEQQLQEERSAHEAAELDHKQQLQDMKEALVKQQALLEKQQAMLRGLAAPKEPQ